MYKNNNNQTDLKSYGNTIDVQKNDQQIVSYKSIERTVC